MKIGDRDTPGTRIYAETRVPRGRQVLVATEAAGEGINLQFCWLMINYDIPWNPVRLEQRMGRIHRYGQEHDCLVFNFVAVNTREGRVLEMLLTRLAEIRKDLESDKVFDVVGEVFPSNLLEKMFRDLYAGKIGESDIKDRVLSELDPKRFKQITGSTLEGLAKRDLNLSAIIGKTAEAKERRLVPEVIEDFATPGRPYRGHAAQAGEARRPRLSRRQGPEELGRLVVQRRSPGSACWPRNTRRIAFDKDLLKDDATLEWVTPGHPLFEAVRADVIERVADDSGAAQSSTTSTRRSRTASTSSRRRSRTAARTSFIDGSSSCASTTSGFVRSPAHHLPRPHPLERRAKAPDERRATRSPRERARASRASTQGMA